MTSLSFKEVAFIFFNSFNMYGTNIKNFISLKQQKKNLFWMQKIGDFTTPLIHKFVPH